MRITQFSFSFSTLAIIMATCLFAEVPNRSREHLTQTATHIITGDVLRVYQRVEQRGMREVTQYLAEIRVKTVEKGDGMNADSLIYVRYFTQVNPPGVTDTGGHRNLPSEGDHVRVFLVRNASDGYNRTNNDGGLNVVFPNGVERLEKDKSN